MFILAAATAPTMPAFFPAEARTTLVGLGNTVHWIFLRCFLTFFSRRSPDSPSVTPPARTMMEGSSMRMKLSKPTARYSVIVVTTLSARSSPLRASSNTAWHVSLGLCLILESSPSCSMISWAVWTTALALAYISRHPRCPHGHSLPSLHTTWWPPSMVLEAPATSCPPMMMPAPTPVPRVIRTRSSIGGDAVSLSSFLRSAAAPTHSSAAVAASASLFRTTVLPPSSSETILARGTFSQVGKLEALITTPLRMLPGEPMPTPTISDRLAFALRRAFRQQMPIRFTTSSGLFLPS
mmetsp:Transcript_22286/g.41833  ORF Transcript_22286/g.41833 Transcript_22286/m.41833 type:complete len:295 (+) Transcript_22286:217-1101(+)